MSKLRLIGTGDTLSRYPWCRYLLIRYIVKTTNSIPYEHIEDKIQTIDGILISPMKQIYITLGVYIDMKPGVMTNSCTSKWLTT